MNDHHRRHLEDFFNAIETNLPGYQHTTFSFFALKKGDAFEIVQARLQLQGVPVNVPSGCFESENIKAGIFRLSEIKQTPKTFVENILTGTLQTLHGELLFQPEKDRSYSVHYSSHDSDGIAAQCRHMRLFISGDRSHRFESTQLDWELKAACTPFFNIQELCDEFLVGTLGRDSANLEIIAFNVAAVATASSIVGKKAKLEIVLADGLKTEMASIGYRVFERNKVSKRGLLTGSELNWEKIDNVQRGRGEIEVPAGSVIDCVVNYAGSAQNHRWIADPHSARNPLRSVHHAFDNNLEVLQELITKAQNRGSHARDLEVAISWLLWMLGFSATHIGGTPKTSDAPDLIASTPRGDLVVIECTTSILKEDSKLSHLFQRAEKVRQSLAASGNPHLKVLPIIITTKTRDEVKAEIKQAHELGVLVATQEDFLELINRTMLFPDPNGLYAEAEATLHRLQNPSPFGTSDTTVGLLNKK